MLELISLRCFIGFEAGRMFFSASLLMLYVGRLPLLATLVAVKRPSRIQVASLALSGLASAQQSYEVQRFGRQTILVLLNPVKTRPRQWSAFDPSNPYRVDTFDYRGQNGLGETQDQVINTPNQDNNKF